MVYMTETEFSEYITSSVAGARSSNSIVGMCSHSVVLSLNLSLPFSVFWLHSQAASLPGVAKMATSSPTSSQLSNTS